MAASASGLGTEIASLFAKVGLDQEIPELCGYRIEPRSFGTSERFTTRESDGRPHWQAAQQGLDRLTLSDINAEIRAVRKQKQQRP